MVDRLLVDEIGENKETDKLLEVLNHQIQQLDEQTKDLHPDSGFQVDSAHLVITGRRIEKKHLKA